ncbi:MAG: 3-mercaptopyruvate sulfurtransferase [Gammaproteobacteria bacterium]
MTPLELPESLVSAAWLRDHLEHPQLVVFDASWYMPAAQRNAREEWRSEQIKNARYFDFDQTICDPDSELPHMMPDATRFTAEVQKLGLNRDSVAVVYDTQGMFSSPRVWWMLRAMGFENCGILDGGLPAWKAGGYPLSNEAEASKVVPGNFVASPVASRSSDTNEVLAAIGDDAVTILDARSSERFSGEAEEPRPGLRKGHMPGAINLPFTDLFSEGLMKSKSELKTIYGELIPPDKHTICSCGSGITACVIAFGAHLVGYDDISVYDGSWCEWGQPGELPVVSEYE